MSLLSGIKFVPKEQRAPKKDDGENDKDGRAKNKSHHHLTTTTKSTSHNKKKREREEKKERKEKKSSRTSTSKSNRKSSDSRRSGDHQRTHSRRTYTSSSSSSPSPSSSENEHGRDKKRLNDSRDRSRSSHRNDRSRSRSKSKSPSPEGWRQYSNKFRYDSREREVVRNNNNNNNNNNYKAANNDKNSDDDYREARKRDDDNGRDHRVGSRGRPTHTSESVSGNREYHSSNREEKDNGKTISNYSQAESFDVGKFSSLINRLKGKESGAGAGAGAGADAGAGAGADNETKTTISTSMLPTKREPERQDAVNPNGAFVTNAGATATSSVSSSSSNSNQHLTNLSAAAMLRQKLLASKTAALLPSDAPAAAALSSTVNSKNADSKTETAPSSSSSSAVYSNELQRNMVLMQAQKARIDSLSAAATDKGKEKNKAGQDPQQRTEEDILALLRKEKQRNNGGDDDNYDMDKVFRNNVLRLGERYKGTELGGRVAGGGPTGTRGDKAGMGEDEEGEVDMKLFENKHADNSEEGFRRQVARALREEKRFKDAVENCRYCESSSKKYEAAAVISKGEHAYLRLKDQDFSFTEGHCEIVPVDHVSSNLQCDAETIVEISRFKDCLRLHFRRLDLGVVFLETASNIDGSGGGGGGKRHAVIDCVPVTRQEELEVGMYFKEAFTSCDEEWGQQSKKCIELSALKGLANVVPTQFSYLVAEWGNAPDKAAETERLRDISNGGNGSVKRYGSAEDGLSYGGYVHPIENDSSIDSNFCLDVLAGVLDVDTVRLRKAAVSHHTKQQQQQQQQRQQQRTALFKERVANFKKEFDMYDWTVYC